MPHAFAERWLALVASLALLVASLLVGGTPAGAMGPVWTAAGDATITPGSETYTGGGQCTANFVFTDGSDVYLGQAAHCAGLGAATDTNGCSASSLPLGTPVTIAGATRPGELAYSSWQAMQQGGETDPLTCAYNDFALVRLHPDDRDAVNPSIPFWGGPVGLESEGTQATERVYSYGNSSLRLGLAPLSPKTGVSLGTSAGGWSHPVYTLSPGIPGDSGSAFLDAEGKAVGTLSTLSIAPLAGSNGVSDLSLALAYLAHVPGAPRVQLVPGTEPFSPLL